MENNNFNKKPTQPWVDILADDREDPDIEDETQTDSPKGFQGAESGCDDQSPCDSEGEDSRDSSPTFNINCGVERVLTSSGSESGQRLP